MMLSLVQKASPLWDGEHTQHLTTAEALQKERRIAPGCLQEEQHH